MRCCQLVRVLCVQSMQSKSAVGYVVVVGLLIMVAGRMYTIYSKSQAKQTTTKDSAIDSVLVDEPAVRNT